MLGSFDVPVLSDFALDILPTGRPDPADVPDDGTRLELMPLPFSRPPGSCGHHLQLQLPRNAAARHPGHPVCRATVAAGLAGLDLARTVAMPASAMADRGLVHGCFVRLSSAPSAKLPGTTLATAAARGSAGLLAQVCCLGDGPALEDQRTAAVWLPKPLLRQLLPAGVGPGEMGREDAPLVTVHRTAAPQRAVRVHIARVAQGQGPAGKEPVRADAALRAYFASRRLLQVGQLLQMRADRLGEVAGLGFSAGPQRLEQSPHDTVVFRVMSLEGPCGALRPDAEYGISEPGVTALSQGGAVRCATAGCARELPCGCVAPCCAGLEAHRQWMMEATMASLRAGAEACPPMLLLRGPHGAGKSRLAVRVAAELGLHVSVHSCKQLHSDVAGRTRARLGDAFEAARGCAPSMLVLRDVDALCTGDDSAAAVAQGEQTADLLLSLARGAPVPLPKGEAAAKQKARKRQPPPLVEGEGTAHGWRDAVFVVGTTTSTSHDKQGSLLRAFANDREIGTLDEAQRLAVLSCAMRGASVGSDVDTADIAKNTAGYRRCDLLRVVRGASVRQAAGAARLGPETAGRAGVQLGGRAVADTLAVLREASKKDSGQPQVPRVTWADVGGLQEAKAEVLETIQMPLRHPELFVAGLRRSGLLLYGPPGSGKTLMAKAVATECRLNFFSVKGPELINMYVGQSEANVRAVFARARAARPCIVFFDELDALAPKRGASGDSGGVMDRVVSQLLAEIDGMNSGNDVFVVGATNRPDLIDDALLRPGRLDRMVYLGIDGGRSHQHAVLRALTRKFTLAPAFDLERVLDVCQPTFSGADLYALCADAMLKAIRRRIAEGGGGARAGGGPVVTAADFAEAAGSLVPSVSAGELRRYEALRQQFSPTRAAEAGP